MPGGPVVLLGQGAHDHRPPLGLDARTHAACLVAGNVLANSTSGQSYPWPPPHCSYNLPPHACLLLKMRGDAVCPALDMPLLGDSLS